MKTNTWVNRAFFFLFTMLFFTEIYVISTKIENILDAPVFVWVLIGFATLRLAHTVSFNGVAEWMRFLFVKEVEDTSGAGNSLEAKDGFFNVIGQLLTCPICSGTWSAMFLVSVYVFSQTIGLAFIIVLGVAGISEMLHWASETFEWTGRSAREVSGTLWIYKNIGNPIGYYRENSHDIITGD